VEVVHERDAASLAGVLLDPLNAAKRRSRLPPRFICCKSIADESIRLDIDVETEFIRELAFDVTVPEQRTEAKSKVAPEIAKHAARSARFQHETDGRDELRPRI
jgi:hypothetical protein